MEGGNMASTQTEPCIDWMVCELIEAVPGKVSGKPVVRGTRIMPDAIVNSYELGDSIDDIHEGFPTLSLDKIKELIDFAESQRQRHHGLHEVFTASFKGWNGLKNGRLLEAAEGDGFDVLLTAAQSL
jgi:uncharacterized protein (DUF433 family)